ncbi:hypothetical protein GXB85_10485 [Cellulomonas sp. APG4]|uniref:AAA family ATPase n=1 Tax=Cellulomonas sp. APG4 TaxID=1538656 RepID=UPI00137B5434|nr:hypothetical protein [Cellulomonas sp. APG4]NCT91376.1 hypothetical protein [Cellulomonas sp. APG4]
MRGVAPAGVLCAVRGPAEQDVVRALCGHPRELHVSRRCADLAELLAAADAGHGSVAVVSADLPGLDREAVRHLHGSGAWVVLLADLAGPAGAHALGADALLDGGDLGDPLVATVRGLLDRAADGARPGGRPPGAGAQAPSRLEAVLGGPGAAPTPSRPGRVVAVWGPTGAPGRTTVALGVADALTRVAAAENASVLLVDADTYGGTVAQQIGLLDEAPGLAAATRTAATGRLDAVTLAALTPRLDSGLRVLTGLSRAERWPEVTASGLTEIWRAARELATWTVVDCGFCVEQDEALSYDTRAPRRNGATLSALEEADLVLVVGAGDPIGLQRLVHALGQLDALGVATAHRRVVVNRLRASASGSRPEVAVRAALERYAGVREVSVLPDDRATCDGAVLAARTLYEQDPTAALTRALVELAGTVLAAVPPAPADGDARGALAGALVAGAH